MKYLYLCNTFARLMLQNIVLALIQYTYFKVVFLGFIRFLGYICRTEGMHCNMDIYRSGLRHEVIHGVKLECAERKTTV